MDRITVAGHPIHPMLVSIPIGLWLFSLISDVTYAATADARWETTAFFTLGGGIAGALIAALPGFFDLLALREGRERRIGMLHMSVNLAIVALQTANFWLRWQQIGSTSLTLSLSVIAVGALVLSGWLGGHLVHVLGVTQPGRDR